MTELDYYEIVRPKLKLGPLFAPKHDVVYKLMKILWNEEEIRILANFKSAEENISLVKLEKKLGISKTEIKKILARSVKNGTISRIGNKYTLKPLLPGIFESYFFRRFDSKENQLKVAKLYKEFIKNVFPQQMIETNFTIFRPLLPYQAEEKIIKIEQPLSVQSQVLPFESVEILINKNEIFATVPCQCRLVGEYSDDPCKIAPSDLGCLLGGIVAQEMIKMGIGKQLTKKEAIEHIKRAEKLGLVHNTAADTSVMSSIFICNCCSCHCGILAPTKKYRINAITPGNFLPRIDNDLCKKCEICEKKCQMDAIYHQWPNEPDSSDEHMFIREEYCIGCGICASNCPNNAIKMIKIRNNNFSNEIKFGKRPFLELFI